MEQVIPKPVPENLGWWRSLTRRLPGCCSYCGRLYVPCHSPKINLFYPVPQNGMCCPDGHEGYVDEHHIPGYSTRRRFDLVQDAHSEEP